MSSSDSGKTIHDGQVFESGEPLVMPNLTDHTPVSPIPPPSSTTSDSEPVYSRSPLPSDLSFDTNDAQSFMDGVISDIVEGEEHTTSETLEDTDYEYGYPPPRLSARNVKLDEETRRFLFSDNTVIRNIVTDDSDEPAIAHAFIRYEQYKELPIIRCLSPSMKAWAKLENLTLECVVFLAALFTPKLLAVPDTPSRVTLLTETLDVSRTFAEYLVDAIHRELGGNVGATEEEAKLAWELNLSPVLARLSIFLQVRKLIKYRLVAVFVKKDWDKERHVSDLVAACGIDSTFARFVVDQVAKETNTGVHALLKSSDSAEMNS